MLPRQYRLRRQRDFKETYRNSRRYDDRDLSLYVRAREDEKIRMGIVAGKKVGSSVERNRAKRLLRAACRELMSRMVPGFDAIIVARRSHRGKKLADVQSRLERLLQEAGRLRAEAGAGDSRQSLGGGECAGCSSQ